MTFGPVSFKPCNNVYDYIPSTFGEVFGEGNEQNLIYSITPNLNLIVYSAPENSGIVIIHHIDQAINETSTYYLFAPEQRDIIEDPSLPTNHPDQEGEIISGFAVAKALATSLITVYLTSEENVTKTVNGFGFLKFDNLASN